MKRLLLTLIAVAISAFPGFAQVETWNLDPAHSAAHFAVRHMGISTVHGAFSKLSGTVQYDPAHPEQTVIDVTIDANSVDTRVEMRDKDLRSVNFFDVEKYPTITFKSKKVEAAGPGKLNVTGDLTIHGVTKEAVLDVEGPTPPVKDPWGNTRVAANATTKINRQDFGVKWNANMDGGGVVVGDDVAITIDLEMIKKAAK